jgi:hypothetical protein
MDSAGGVRWVWMGHAAGLVEWFPLLEPTKEARVGAEGGALAAVAPGGAIPVAPLISHGVVWWRD